MMVAWTPEWPQDKGAYWFFGTAFKDDVSRLYFVEVRSGGGASLFYVTNGHFLYKSEGAEGLWQKAQLPVLPEKKS